MIVIGNKVLDYKSDPSLHLFTPTEGGMAVFYTLRTQPEVFMMKLRITRYKEAQILQNVCSALKLYKYVLLNCLSQTLTTSHFWTKIYSIMLH